MGIPSSAVSQTPPAGDRANAVVTGALNANGAKSTDAGQGGPFMAQGPFNLCLFGNAGPNGNWNATVRLERSFDGGTTWIVCGIGGSGQQAQWNTANQDVSVVIGEPEDGVLYRLNVTAFANGPINYRFSTTGGAGKSLAISAAI